MIVRTRFAPSPTGYLHVGGLRTALYAYLLAKQNKGQFLLRIEDTDRERFVADGTLNILKSLYWAGIIPDEGVKLDADASGENQIIQEGKKGSYIQSERLEIYQKYAQELVAKGHAYYCFCSSERLTALREQQSRLKQPTSYDGLCAQINPQEAQKRALAGEKCVIRLKMPKAGETSFKDLIRGSISVENKLVDDQVIIKSDGYPTYHLAVVVDDHLMEITHVVRGEEWISSTPKHLQLYEYFGWKPPQFAHLPLLLNPDKSKLSKRQGDVAVEDYRQKGYLPEAILNFVAFLGWNPGDDREIFSLKELIKEFSLEKVGKAGAVFNLEKLNWYNKEYLKRLTDEELVKLAMPFLEKKIGDRRYEISELAKIIALEKERVTTLAELPEALSFIFDLPKYPSDLLVWKKSSAEEVKKVLPELSEVLNKISVQAWTKEKLEQKVGEWTKENNYSNGAVLWPLRVSVSGQDKSPGPFEIMEALGKEESLTRLGTALSKMV
ncbi:MAG: glutamate--tRNA ligase [Patescibacteria group bacterium]